MRYLVKFSAVLLLDIQVESKTILQFAYMNAFRCQLVTLKTKLKWRVGTAKGQAYSLAFEIISLI